MQFNNKYSNKNMRVMRFNLLNINIEIIYLGYSKRPHMSQFVSHITKVIGGCILRHRTNTLYVSLGH